MRMVFGLVLLAGVALAGFAVYMVQGYVNAYQDQLARERAARPVAVETVDVYVADKQLQYGQVLAKDDVRLVAWPKAALPEGVFTATSDLFGSENTPPRFVLRSMERNEAVMGIKVTAPGEDAGLTSRLERGMRAFAIKVDVSSGVSGFLRSGDKVDVYWTGRLGAVGGIDRGEFTKLIESAVKLIAVDQTANGDSAQATIARTVTVAVTPDQVAALAQAQSTGRLSLALVGAGDDTIAKSIEVDQRRLLGLVEEQAPVETVEAKPKERCTIKTRRGAEVIETEIACTN